MESKYLKIILIAALVGVWGGVGFNIFTGIKGKQPSFSIHKSSLKSSTEILPDSFSIVNSYPDPFIPDSNEYDDDSTSKLQSASIIMRSVENVDSLEEKRARDYIKCNGIITNSVKKRSVALMVIGSGTYVVKSGDRAVGVIIKAIKRHSVSVLFNNRFYVIPSSD